MIFGSGVRKIEPKICARSFVKPLKRKELAGRNTEAVARIVLHNFMQLIVAHYKGEWNWKFIRENNYDAKYEKTKSLLMSIF